MHANALLSIVSALALTASAAPVTENNPIEARAGACSSYTIINTRGTGEAQGPSAGFLAINRRLTAEVPGGKVYNTVYFADASQNSALGTADIINKIQSTLRTSPDECFILQGYSQGAAATVNAMNRITGPNFDAVKGVFLIGNPNHKAGLACNVDVNGGATTRNVNGLSVALGSIPQNWVGKTLDVCAFADGVCDTTHGFGINAVHLTYPTSAATQKLGVDFAKKQLGA
ncbi:carbohydrate esterase family 5 protein [Apiospora hydei]|uniref:Carbohydrate esterase family 5 protein n=1 Tax=Apiospora hydei TaxID=1337664 RepID=A0ABR1VVR9_9PEZI